MPLFVTEDLFTGVMGITRGNGKLYAPYLAGRSLPLTVAPYAPTKETRDRYLRTPLGQRLVALLVRPGDKYLGDQLKCEVYGKDNHPLLIFYTADFHGDPDEMITHISCGTFLCSTSADGLFPLTIDRPSSYYITQEVYDTVREWLLSQPDAELLKR